MTPVDSMRVDDANDTEITLGTGKMLAIFFGLVCELFLTPPLIIAFKLTFKDKKTERGISAPAHDVRV